MKFKYFSIFILVVLLITACSPAAANNSAPAPVEQAVTNKGQSISPTEVMQTEKPAESMAAAEVSFSTDIWPVIEKFALSAHGGKGGVFLESYTDIAKYVVPGDPEGSMLYKRLTGDGVSVMPPNGPLPSDTIQLFYDWIKQGAKNN